VRVIKRIRLHGMHGAIQDREKQEKKYEPSMYRSVTDEAYENGRMDSNIALEYGGAKRSCMVLYAEGSEGAFYKLHYQSPSIIFKLNSTPTNVAAYCSISNSFRRLVTLTFAGKALAMAGPNPFQSAVTPSAATNFLAQSMNPV
jgi:hypothetical protein